MSQVLREVSTAERIMETALDLFAESNYEATSMREIANAVGVKPASLYNHYSSKEDIVWMIVQTAWEGLEAEHEEEAVDAETPVQRLEAFVRAHARYHAREPRHAAIANRHLTSLGPERYRQVISRRSDYEHRLRQILADGVEAGVFEIEDLRVTSFAILEMGMGIARWFRPGGELTINALQDLHAHLALRMAGYRP